MEAIKETKRETTCNPFLMFEFAAQTVDKEEVVIKGCGSISEQFDTILKAPIFRDHIPSCSVFHACLAYQAIDNPFINISLFSFYFFPHFFQHNFHVLSFS
ncbi:hypothetical protein S245_065638 [Arachis hypogaea]